MTSFGEDDFQRATGASDAQMAAVCAYRDLLADWNSRMNLVGPSALEAFWLRHAWDSAQLLPLAPDAKIWADIGSGAGFPALILAIFLKDAADVRFHLVESIAKKCRFLSTVAETLALPVTVHNVRAETLRLKAVDVVTARACAPVDRLLSFAYPLLRQGAEGLFLKGRDVDRELEDAKRHWRFTAELAPSRSDPEGKIVRVGAVARG